MPVQHHDHRFIDDKLTQGGPPAAAYAVYQVAPEATQVEVVSQELVGVTLPLAITTPRADAPKVDDEPDAATVAKAKGDVAGLVTQTGSNAKQVTDQGTRVSINLNTDLLFAFNKADLTSAAQAELRSVASQVGAEATGTVTIVGHTDDVGSDSYNLGLSQRRAESVQAALAPLLRGKGLSFQALLAAPPAGVTSVDLLFSGFSAAIRNGPISG